MNTISLTHEEHRELRELHEEFQGKAKLGGCSAAAASFLLIGALIVITCGCLCLMLPGVNALTHVVFPAIIPGAFGILASLPFIFRTIKYKQESEICRKHMISRMLGLLARYKIPEMAQRRERVNFILKNFLNWKQGEEPSSKLLKNKNWSNDYQGKILSDLKDKVGKDKKAWVNLGQKRVAKALDQARIKINKK